MGYSANASLAELFPEDLDRTVGLEITERVGDEFLEGVVEKTPVAEIPPAYKGNVKAWVKDRRGREPGTAKKSWERTPVRERPTGFSTTVFSDDPVMRHIEDDTRPHLIRAKKPGGALRFPYGLDFIIRRQVSHPGTQGVHMMRDTEAEMEVRWQAIGEEILREQASSVARRLPVRRV